MNTTEINGFKGFVGYGIRELNANEFNSFCQNTTTSPSTKIPLVNEKVNFTNDFYVRAFACGCYFYDIQTGKWSSNGMELMFEEIKDLKYAYCSSNHLTMFASGLSMFKSNINFEYMFTDVSIKQNTLIYVTLLIIASVNILVGLWACFMDKRDVKRSQIYSMKDNCPSDNYFYEVIVFTGDQSDACTQSKVK
jgi:hypothetical protein